MSFSSIPIKDIGNIFVLLLYFSDMYKLLFLVNCGFVKGDSDNFIKTINQNRRKFIKIDRNMDYRYKIKILEIQNYKAK